MSAGQAKSAFGATHRRAYTRETWLTPPHVLAALGEFELDPCAAPSPRPWPTAARHIELPDDGLAIEWSGRVWMNPPYGAELARWLDKLASHGNGVALAFARTETAAFQEHVWPRAHAVLFLRGRLSFCAPSGKPGGGTAAAPSMLIAYGEDNAQALARCGLPGGFARLDPTNHATPSDLFTPPARETAAA